MPATVIMGGQWGDEGKGKLTDALADEAAMVVRANGGSNAGHTVQTAQGTFKLHLVPSGILNARTTCVIGAGVVIDPAGLVAELTELHDRGIDTANLRISDRAHIVMPWHPAIDRFEEARREGDEIGTTLRGNGPAYSDKISRYGIRVADVLEPAVLRRKLAIEIDSKNQLFTSLYSAPEFDFNDTYDTLMTFAETIRDCVVPTEVVVQDTLAEGKRVLVECAQGSLLDIDYGTYPYVTSSSPTAAGACQGAGVAPTQVDKVIGIYKAYCSRVGAGPMPSELLDSTGDTIRTRGNEFGTTTGRPRRIGWFDAVASRQTARLNGVTDVAVTLLDVLDGLEDIAVCSGYDLGSATLTHVPALLETLMNAKPVLDRYPGWNMDISGLRQWSELPDRAQRYLGAVEGYLGAPISYVGVGPSREQLIAR